MTHLVITRKASTDHSSVSVYTDLKTITDKFAACVLCSMAHGHSKNIGASHIRAVKQSVARLHTADTNNGHLLKNPQRTRYTFYPFRVTF